MVFIIQVYPKPLAKCRRIRAYIDSDIPDTAACHKDQFALRVRELIMQSAQYIACGPGYVVLYECGNAKFRITFLLEDLKKIAAIIIEYAGLDNEQPW